MPRVFYDQNKKESIVKAAMDARAANKTWKEAHDAAKEVGYEGSLQGIIKLMRAMEKRKGKTGRRPGRPAGSKNGIKKLTLELPASVHDSSDIASLVNNLVKARINEALDRAIAVLESAKS